MTLRDSLTKAERTLAGRGQALEVLAMRRAFQETMREDLIGLFEVDELKKYLTEGELPSEEN